MVKPSVIQALQRPEAYPHEAQHIELVETHISCVFIAGPRTYKLKKAVNFGFLDFSSLEKRRQYCHQEVRLNRRLAEPIYEGILCVTEDRIGRVRLQAEAATDPDLIVDYAVVMRTVPREALLEHRLKSGQVSQADLRSLASRLVEFHTEAASGPAIDQGGQPATIRGNIEENFEQTRKDIDISLSQRQYTLLKHYSLSFLQDQAPLFKRRIAERRIREGHGDLRADHVCFLDGSVYVLDCIEFNERFRYIDTACDVAFLAMDLDFRGYPGAADTFVQAYLELAGDEDMRTLLPFYQCYYAYARGKVEDLRLRDRHLDGREHQKLLHQAEEHFGLALAYAARPAKPWLLVMCGLSGTGKSRLAFDLARTIRCEVLQSDEIRKRLYGLAPEAKPSKASAEDIYSEDATRKTYDRLFDQAEDALEAGSTVILDATFQRSRDRLRAKAMAESRGASFLLLECRSPETVVRQRLQRRAQEPGEVSDADLSVYRLQTEQFEPVQAIPSAQLLQLDTSLPPRSSLQTVLEALLEEKNRQLDRGASQEY